MNTVYYRQHWRQVTRKGLELEVEVVVMEKGQDPNDLIG